MRSTSPLIANHPKLCPTFDVGGLLPFDHSVGFVGEAKVPRAFVQQISMLGRSVIVSVYTFEQRRAVPRYVVPVEATIPSALVKKPSGLLLL